MKRLIVTLADGKSIIIEDAEDLQKDVLSDDIIYFGNKLAVNRNSLVSYQFVEIKDDKNECATKEDNIKTISYGRCPICLGRIIQGYPNLVKCPKCGQELKW